MRRPQLAVLILLGLGGCVHVTAAKYIYDHRTQIKCAWVHGLHECHSVKAVSPDQHGQSPPKPEQMNPVIEGLNDHPHEQRLSLEGVAENRFEVFELRHNVYEFSGFVVQ
jgi:hypothetical protein